MKRIMPLFALLMLMLLGACAKENAAFEAKDLKVEYKVNPVTDVKAPRLSWLLRSAERNQYQQAYQILVASSPDLLTEADADLWNTGKVMSAMTNQIEYKGKALASRMKCYWKVRAWDKNDAAGAWSNTASWEMGLLNKEDWQADWIAYDLTHLGKGKVYHLPPVPFFRKEVALKGNVKKANLYVSSLGVYEFNINGEKVGEDVLAPGWTNFNKRVYYQVYDVSTMLSKGDNALGAIVSYGWYSGYLGYALLVGLPKVKGFYGDVPKLKAQLEIEYENGEKETIVTDNTWKASAGPIVESDLLNGETYDATMELGAWDKPQYDDTAWEQVEAFKGPEMALQVHPGNPIQITQQIKPVSISKRPDNKYIFDMGQNFAGVVKLKVKGEKGQKVVLRFGEMLHQDGSLMTKNLRRARATDTYILKGDPNGEEWAPRFTFHGFQFVEVTGLSQAPTLNDMTGLVIESNTPDAGSFECSDPMVNQLYSNIVWTQRSNFLDIPTDCPQRDERLGWTGDAQIYISTAILNKDVSAFFTKWMVDLNDDQNADGTYPNFAPSPFRRDLMDYSPGWMEAGVICPYHMYKAYGDKAIVEKYWANMEQFMDFHIQKAGDDYVHEEATFEEVRPKGGFSDWLSIGTKTSPELLATLYFGYSAKLMAEMAEGIGNKERAAHYRALFKKVQQGFLAHYSDGKGGLICNAEAYGDGAKYVDGERGFTGHTQTAYANAIYMGFFEGKLKEIAGKHLRDLVVENGNKLTTGFLGVKPLLPALSQTGSSDLAYILLLNKEYPSWGFEIENGATSIWERWNSYTKKDGFMAGMNSFSHYSFGSVYEWMFNHMAGVKNEGVGFKTLVFQPEVSSKFDYVKASYQSINGQVQSQWKRRGNELVYNITVPVNTKATVVLPAPSTERISENNITIDQIKDISNITSSQGTVSFEVGSGNYVFVVK